MTVDSAVDLVRNSKTDYKWQSSLQFQIESSGLVDETKTNISPQHRAKLEQVAQCWAVFFRVISIILQKSFFWPCKAAP